MGLAPRRCPGVNTANKSVPHPHPHPTGCGTQEWTAGPTAGLALALGRQAWPWGARVWLPTGGDSFQDRSGAVPPAPFSRCRGAGRCREFVSALSDALGGAGVPAPHFEGDCAVTSAPLVRGRARGLYFPNRVQHCGTGMGVSSPPDPLPPLGPRLTPRALPPSGHSRLYNCWAPPGRDRCRGLPSTQGLGGTPTRGEQRQSERQGRGRGK